MAKEIIDIEVQSNIKMVSDHTAALEENLKRAGKAGKESGKEISGGMQAANAGVGILDRFTGGLASKFMAVGQAAMKSGKAMKAALISSGIGLAVALVGMLLTNWDAIGEALGFINKDLEKQKKLNDENLRVVDSQVGLLEKQIKFNKDRGIANEENLKKHKELLNTKRGILALGLQILEAQLLQEESVVHEKGWWDTWGKFLGYKGKSKATLAALTEESTIKINDLRLAINKLKGEQLDLENILNPVRTRSTGDPDKTDEEIALENTNRLLAENIELEKERTDQLIIDANRLVDEYYETLNTAEQNQLNAVEDKYFAIIEGKRAMGESVVELEKAQAAEQKKITDKYKAERDKASDDDIQFTKDSVNAQIAAFGGLASALSGLAGDNKELAVGEAIISTYVGANKAFAQGGVAGFVTAASIIAAGLANVQKIYATPVGSSGGVSGVSAMPPAPQMMSGAFELTGGQEVEPARAYVVSDDITNNQNKLAIIRRRATI